MFCYAVRRRLYDFLQGELDEKVSADIESHIGSCSGCAGELQKLKSVLRLISENKAPEVTDAFWADFDEGLKKKLAESKEMPEAFTIRPGSPRISLRPVYALATVLVLMAVFNFYFFGGLPTKSRLDAAADERLVNDIVIIEELTEETIAFDDGDFLLQEFFLLEELESTNGSA